MQTVVITGGTSGIGLATAEIFLKHDWNAVLIGRDAQRGAAVADQLGQKYSPSQVIFVQADISNSADVERAKQTILNRFTVIDALVNNAGIVIHGKLHETSEEDWDRIFAVDVKGTYLVSKAFLPTMINQQGGSIVNISSVSGLAGDRAMVAYNAAKGAIINMTRADQHTALPPGQAKICQEQPLKPHRRTGRSGGRHLLCCQSGRECDHGGDHSRDRRF